jgi:hypothetical protein
MRLGQRQLFIYWRVAAIDLPAALGALRDWQSDLLGQQPQLRCGLYQRIGSDEAEATVMESYALESALPHPGIDEALCRYIDRAGQALLQRWLSGARHVEVFDALNA